MKTNFLWPLVLVSGCVIQADKDGRVVEPTPMPTAAPTLAPGVYPKCIQGFPNVICPATIPAVEKCWDGGITAVCPKVPTPEPIVTPTATPEPTPKPFEISAPVEVMQCTIALVTVRGPAKEDDVVIWAEKKFHVGRMFFDALGDKKYLPVKLNTSGRRTLDFKVNGEWLHSVVIRVKPSQENCAAK